MYDCIIVGAGPAGGAAAYHLAKKGRSVLILEQESLPRYKPCVGGVSPVIGEWFDFDFSPAISLKINTIRYTWKMDDPVEVKLDTAEPMWMVRRDRFDHFLVQQAQKQGATLQDGTAVTGIQFNSDRWQVNTAQGPQTGRFLIAADGAKGPMAKWLGFKEPKTSPGATLEISLNGSATEKAEFEFGLAKNGYIWTFPKADGYSIGVATFRGNDRQNLGQVLREYAQSTGMQLQNPRQYDHPLSLWDGDRKLHSQNALLAGEAASIVDPLTGEGVRPAIATGIKAATAIDQALSGNSNALEQYTEAIVQEWGSDLVWAQRLAGVFYRIPGVSYRLGVKRPAATRRMGQILCGQLRYGDIANFAIKKLSTGLIPGRG
uniref:Geranylgeranyl reductase n=1 Tax=Cyanothece sp. (strain PCC 7425 / ATCC 29141) TaxID=395961 RepID=B8HW79_CYAP4